MATRSSRVGIPAAVAALALTAGLGLAACGDDDSGSSATTTAQATTTAKATTTTAKATTTTAKATTTTAKATTTTAKPSASTTAADGVARITVTVGVDDAATKGERVEQIAKGQQVELTVIPSKDEELHLHGYDLEQEGTAGVPVVFKFTADTAGEFELEGHSTDTVYVVLQVA